MHSPIMEIQEYDTCFTDDHDGNVSDNLLNYVTKKLIIEFWSVLTVQEAKSCFECVLVCVWAVVHLVFVQVDHLPAALSMSPTHNFVHQHFKAGDL